MSGITYDKMGNIQSLTRNGFQNGSDFTDMDILDYDYQDNSNKLVKVADTGNTNHGFKDGSNNNDDFVYDENGNMIQDLNKGIKGTTTSEDGIEYNHLNLPTLVRVNNGSETGIISYIYDATGVKLQKNVLENGSIKSTDYAGNYIYEKPAGGERTLQFFSTPGGYVEPKNPQNLGSGFNYIYQYKDHLGNVRLSYTDNNGDGEIKVQDDEIVEENNYYPFGLKHKGYNSVVNSTNPALKYKYNGKELQDELGLDVYDYGARNYQPDLGRWMNIDPLAEAYYGINPYGYVFNNPVQLFDPDGMRVKYVREEGQTRKEFRQARREFKKRNRQLSRDSKTHKSNFRQLKKSENTHSISFNRGKGSKNATIGEINRSTGNDSAIEIDLDQESDGNQGNEFVVAHEVAHAIDVDNGTGNPIEADVNYLEDSPATIVQKNLDASNQNSEINESNASHVENIVRGEVSNSRGKVVPLRATYTIGVESINIGKYNITPKVINVIRKNYDYYKKPSKKGKKN